MSKKKLGRGLGALLSDSALKSDLGEAPQTEESVAPKAASPTAGVMTVAVTDIQPSPYQPRRHFDDEALAELANSIQRSGLLQPLVVREKAQGGYELIAGERRLRAAGLAGMSDVPVVIRAVSDQEASALALIENIQREDLNALEEAQGLARLKDEFELTQQQIADAVGKSRVAIANLLRLLNLGHLAREMLANGDLEMGHARALLSLEGIVQDRAASQVVEEELSVRQTEALVRKLQSGENKTKKAAVKKDADTQRLEQRLTDHMGAPVSIKHSAQGRGEVVIKYTSLEELDGVIRHFGLSESE